MQYRKKNNSIAFFALMIALAFTLSFLEGLIPFNFGIPGVKLGLANLVVVVALYIMPPYKAFVIAIVRIVMAAMIFGNIYTFMYSFCGGLLSFAVMLMLKRLSTTPIGVSAAGGVCHNIGQIIVAAFVMTNKIIYYLPVLLVSGVLTGCLLGIISNALIPVVNKVKNKN